MKLAQVVANYMELKQSMGMRYETEGQILKAFCQAMGDSDISGVKSSSVLAYIAGNGPVTSFWRHKFNVLNGFYRFAIGRGYTQSSPLPKTVPKQPESLVPYIYTCAELRQLLEVTNILDTDKRFVIRASSLRALLQLLYGTGLRIGEALSLTLADVDLLADLIKIRSSKFFKTRLVPIAPRLTTELKAYAEQRLWLPLPAGQDSFFFATRNGTGMATRTVNETFRRLCNTAGIRRNDGGRYQPRLHDIRHTFAVSRLVAWYRQGADVQRLLPQLSTYLGHVGIAGTQRYLNMTPELLQEANRRFERYILTEVQHD
jgi:site-specific recombinase XerD